MAGEPDVRVRLTPEGLGDVLAAFKKLQAESAALQKKVAQPAAGGGFLGGLGEAITRMRGGLAGLAKAFGPVGVAATLATAAGVAFAAFAQNIGNAAEATQNMARTSGTSIENLQALELMARDNAVEQGQFFAALARTGDGLADLRDGLPEAVKRFAQLGLAAKDFEGKDVAESMQLVARAVNDLPADQRLRALKDIFGDKKGALGAFMDELAHSSLPDVIARYKELGILLDGKVVKAAALVGNTFGKVQAQAQSMATLFLSSAGPGIVAALTEILDVVAENKDTIAEMGRIFGAILAPAATLALIPIRAIATEIGIAVEAAAALAEFVKEFASSAFSGNQEKLDKAATRLGAALDPRKHGKVFDDAAKGMLDVFTQITRGPKALNLPEDPDTREKAKANLEAQFRDREAFLKASADSELAILRAKNKLNEQENQRSFDEGLRSLTTFFAERRALLEDEHAQVIRGIDLKIGLTQKDPALTPAQRDRTVKTLESQRLVEQLEFVQKMTALGNDEVKERRRLGQRVLQAEIETTTDLERLNHDRITQINAEAAEMEEALRQFTGSPEVAARASAQFKNQKIGKLEFENLTKDADRELSQLGAARAQIEEEVAAGLLSQTQGEARVLAIERDRLPVLQKIADELVAIADRTRDPETGLGGDEQMIAQAEAFAASIRNVELAVKSAEFSLQKLKATAIDAARAGLVDVLVSTKDGFDDLGESALRAADDVVQALQRMAAEALATEIFQGGGGFLKSVGSFFKNLIFAEGGHVHGPGTETSDSIPAWLSNNEFVEPAATVRVPGVLPHLEALRSVRSESDFHRTIASTFSRGDTENVTRRLTSRDRMAFAEGGTVRGPGTTFSRGDIENVTRRLTSRDRRAFAEGGPVRGPGTGTSDSIPAWLSNNEFVEPAATVRVPGVLPHLEALRHVRSESEFRRTIAASFSRTDMESVVRGMNARVPALSEFMPRFAEGGLVGASSFAEPLTQAPAAAPASPSINGKLQIELGEGLEGRLLNGREFEKAVMRIMHKNPRSIGAALGVRR